MDDQTRDEAADLAVIAAIRARGPVWIPADEAQQAMEEMLADAERQAERQAARAAAVRRPADRPSS